MEETICQQTVSVTRLTFGEWRSALKKEEKKKSESKYYDVKVKSLKQRSTLTSTYVVEKKSKKKIKVHKVRKIYHYN